MKTKLLLLCAVLISLSFKTGGDDLILHSLVKQSESIVKAKVLEQKRCVRLEDGIEECIYELKVIKVYNGTSIKVESTIQATIMSYACMNTDGKMPEAGQELVLFLSTQDKLSSAFKLTDNWLGVQKYNDALDKYLSGN